jgi:hypothetical protein
VVPAALRPGTSRPRPTSAGRLRRDERFIPSLVGLADCLTIGIFYGNNGSSDRDSGSAAAARSRAGHGRAMRRDTHVARVPRGDPPELRGSRTAFSAVNIRPSPIRR